MNKRFGKIARTTGLVRGVTLTLVLIFIAAVQSFYYWYENVDIVHIITISILVVGGAVGIIEFSLRLNARLYQKLELQIKKNEETENALQKSERLYKTLINASPDVVVVTDLEGRIQYASPGTAELLGYDDATSFLGKEALGFIHEEDKSSAKQLLRQTLQEGEMRNVTLRLVKRDGSIVYSELNTAALKDSKGVEDQLLATIRDVTERELATRAQKESDAIFRAVIESAQDLIFIKDRNLHYTMMNPMVASFFGQDLSELLALTDEEIFGPEEAGKIREQDLQVLGGSIVKVEEKWNANGEWRDMHVTKVPLKNSAEEIIGICGIARDITATKESERAIASQKQKEQTYLDIANVIILALDNNGVITMINKKGATILGYSKEELVGKKWFENFVPSQIREQMEIVFATFVNGQIEPPEYYENPILTRAGEERLIAWRNALLYDDKGNIIGTLSSGEDVTESKEIQHALEESEEMYRLLVENANEAIVVVQEGMLKFANRRAGELVDYTEDELLSTPFTQFIHPDDRELVVERHLKRIRGDWVPATYDFRLLTKSGDTRWVELNGIKISWQNRPATLNFINDITTRKEAEDIQRVLYGISNSINTTNDLVELSEFIKKEIGTIMDTTNFYIALYNKQKDTISLPFFADEKDEFNDFPAKGTLTGYVIKTGQPLLAREEELEKLEKSGEIELVGTPSKIWLGVPLQIGSEIIGAVVVQSYTDPDLYSARDMEILKFVSGQMAMAIERKKGEEQIKASLHEKEVLLKEIHHRVKNNLQIIHSLLYLQSKRTTDVVSRELLVNSQTRVRSMALIHEKLYRSNDLSRVDFDEYVRNLIDHLTNIYMADGKRIAIEVSMKDVRLPIDTAIPVGLIVNELVSNSLKYAFPNGRDGKISIEITKQNSERADKSRFTLLVRDNGIGLPPDLEKRQNGSLGMLLVQNLARQLEGEVQTRNEEGAVFQVEFNMI